MLSTFRNPAHLENLADSWKVGNLARQVDLLDSMRQGTTLFTLEMSGAR